MPRNNVLLFSSVYKIYSSENRFRRISRLKRIPIQRFSTVSIINSLTDTKIKLLKLFLKFWLWRRTMWCYSCLLLVCAIVVCCRSWTTSLQYALPTDSSVCWHSVQIVRPQYVVQKAPSSNEMRPRGCDIRADSFGAGRRIFAESVGCRVLSGWRHADFSRRLQQI